MKYQSLSSLAALSLLTCSFNTYAQAPQQPQGWMWGFGVAASQDVYTDFDNRVVPIPIIGYAGERLRIYGPFVSYQLFQEGAVSVDAQLVPVFAVLKKMTALSLKVWKTETLVMQRELH
ncbi:MAG: hypothetical protein VX061_08175 [Pseudomonadota bacterium]|nr:hypothetical protein [Pseudomonadota bacterium]